MKEIEKGAAACCQKVDSRCGIECSKVDCKKEFGFDCKGCVNIPDAPWGHCPVKECCEKKGLLHCGQCESFPCELLNSFAYDKENGEGDGSRLEVCRRWLKEAGGR